MITTLSALVSSSAASVGVLHCDHRPLQAHVLGAQLKLLLQRRRFILKPADRLQCGVQAAGKAAAGLRFRRRARPIRLSGQPLQAERLGARRRNA